MTRTEYQNMLPPVFKKSLIGFDRFVQGLNDTALSAVNFPPFNIEQIGDDKFVITIAVAGFGQEELDVTRIENQLVITGKKAEETAEKTDETCLTLFRGIAKRPFTHRFFLVDHVEVEACALENGILTINLKRELPESAKPRKVEIKAA